MTGATPCPLTGEWRVAEIGEAAQAGSARIDDDETPDQRNTPPQRRPISLQSPPPVTFLAAC